MTEKDQIAALQPDIGVCANASLRRAMRVVSQAYDAAMKPAGLKATQFTLLAVVNRSGPVPLTQLAEILVMDRTTLSRNLRPLITKGWVEIERERDERIRLVSLTETGRSVVAKATPLWREAQSQVSATMGAERLEGLLDDLRALTEINRPR